MFAIRDFYAELLADENVCLWQRENAALLLSVDGLPDGGAQKGVDPPQYAQTHFPSWMNGWIRVKQFQ